MTRESANMQLQGVCLPTGGGLAITHTPRCIKIVLAVFRTGGAVVHFWEKTNVHYRAYTKLCITIESNAIKIVAKLGRVMA